MKAEKISQTVVFPNPERASTGETVPVSASSVIANNTLTLIGTGRTTRATIVETKMARRWRWSALSAGTGAK
jgi:hypothetical protein